MLKKISLLLSLIILLSACGSGNEKQSNGNKTETQSKAEQRKLNAYKNELYISALTVEKNDDLLFIAKRLKQLDQGSLDHMVIVRLLTKQNTMTAEEQERMIEIIEGNMSEVHLPSLKPLLNSSNEAVAIGAFSLLSELELSREIKRIYLNLSHSSISKLVRVEAKNRAKQRHY